MSQDQPAEPADVNVDGSDTSLAVLQWGGEDSARPRGRLARGLAGLRADPRLAPLVAGIAALALLASLVTEWRVWRVIAPDEDPNENPILSGVATFPSVGTAYMIGLSLLAACVTLALAGTRPVRQNARLAGLALTGALIAILITATAQLDQLGGLLDDIAMRPAEVRTEMTYGRGLYLAYAGVLGTALALLLAAPGRRGMAAPGHPGGRSGHQEPDASIWLPEDTDDDWAWPRTGRAAERPAEGPDDLTVEPASPFLPPGDVDGPR